jgi:uncharacterized protein YndB with AHSA1/START domain
MRVSTVFDVPVPANRIAAYLADPRHLVVANHERPIVDRSEGVVSTGSWFVLALDQLRVRIEYRAFEPPHRVVVGISTTGRFSRGTRAIQEFEFTELPGAAGTRVVLTVDGATWWLPGPIARPILSLIWRRRLRRIDVSA